MPEAVLHQNFFPVKEKVLCRNPHCECKVSNEGDYCSEDCARSESINECMCKHDDCCSEKRNI